MGILSYGLQAAARPNDAEWLKWRAKDWLREYVRDAQRHHDWSDVARLIADNGGRARVARLCQWTEDELSDELDGQGIWSVIEGYANNITVGAIDRNRIRGGWGGYHVVEGKVQSVGNPDNR